MDLALFNTAPSDAVRRELEACCDVPRWVDAILAARPYADTVTALQTADAAARVFTEAEVDRALAAHPRIGERAAGKSTEAKWSRREQSSVSTDATTQEALAAGNRDYEERFDRVFLICASGLSADQILTALRARLGNDAGAEAAVVADELRKIALLRLERVLAADEVSA